MRYFLEFAYCGEPFHGWQRQPNATSVQETIENDLSTLLRQKIDITGAGRTDTGVHARQMFAHFDIETIIDKEVLKFRLNSILPAQIAIHQILEVTEEAHARFDATSRSYEYLISKEKDPFLNNLSYYHRFDLDIELMNQAAKQLLNYTNFKCFSKSKTDVKTYHCNITEAYWVVKGSYLSFHISANRFLRNMVRAIVGTLLEIGTGKLTLEDLDRILVSEDRSQAGYSVPARGLYLTKVEYPKQIFN